MRDGENLDVAPIILRDTATWMDGTAREINSGVRKVYGEAQALLGTQWRGGAAGSHEDPWRDWFDAARNLIEALRGDAALLRQVADAYERTDGDNAAGIDTRRSSLDLPL